MIVEIADFKVEPAKHKDFGSAIRQAADSVLSKATGYLTTQSLPASRPRAAMC